MEFVESEDVLQILIVQSIYVKIGNTDVSCQWLANGHDRVVSRIVPSVHDATVSAPVGSGYIGVHVGWNFMVFGLVLCPDGGFRLRERGSVVTWIMRLSGSLGKVGAIGLRDV